MILLLILLICSNLNSITKADDDDDYVNTLPSEERYAFLEKVSRRIVQEVEAKETPNATSFEIPEAMLAKSNEYVNKVVKEELEKIKTARKNNKNRLPVRNVTRPEDREDKYINFTFRTDLHDDIKDHIDLTAAKKRKSIDPTNVRSVKGEDPKIVRKREISEVPVQVLFDKSTGSKRNERRSWDQDNDDDSDRRDDNIRRVEEKSREKGIELDRKKGDVKTLEDKSSESKSLELNKKDEDARTFQSTKPKDLLYGKESSKSEEENKSIREAENTYAVKKIKMTEPTLSTVELDSTKTTDYEVSMTTDSSTTKTGSPLFDDTTFQVRLKDDTYPTTEVFLDTTKVRPLTEYTVGPYTTVELATVPTTQEPQNSTLTILKTKTENTEFADAKPISTITTQESERTMTISQKLESTVSITEEPTSTVTTTQEPESTVSTTEEPTSTVSTTQEPKSTVPTTEEPTSTAATTQKPESTVLTNEKPTSTAATTQKSGSIVPTVQNPESFEFKKPSVKKSLRIGVVSEETDGRNDVYRSDLLLRVGDKTTDAPLHFETLFKVEPKPTKKVRIQEVAEQKVVPSKTHQHGILYYRVYEVDPSLDQLKLRSEINGNQDQPQYAPVYNYEPESVFFSPQNRLGPNLKEVEEDDEQTNFRQTGSKELRTNIDQEAYIPVYNYEPLNAYYNPQNRLGPNVDNAEDDSYYKRAGVKPAGQLSKGKIDEDYYYARNEAIEDSVESRKFSFRGISTVGDLGKSPLKARPLAQNNFVDKHIYATTQKPKNINRNQQNGDYIDYYYGRKDGLRHEGKMLQKRRPSDKLFGDLDEYFNKKKKAQLARSRHSQKRPVYRFVSKDNTNKKAQKPYDGKPISLDYYYGLNDPGALLYKLTHKAKASNVKSLGSTEKPTRNGFRYRTRENNAIDLDYYFDRKETNDGHDIDEDFQDYVDRVNVDTDAVVSRKSHKIKDEKRAKKNVIKPYTRVLKDMFEMRSGVLLKYDWLGTTVNIRSALAKLLDMIDAEEHGKSVNAKDKEILKYLVAVHKEAADKTQTVTKSSTNACVASKFPKVVADALRYKRKLVLPKNKNKKPGERIKNPLKLIRDVYTRLVRSCADAEEEQTAKGDEEFKQFLEELEHGLYDFHMAIKNIASVTKYDKQNWYQNIKDLYLSRPKRKSKELLEVMTHLVVMEIFERIEQSAKDGLEENSVKYRETHPDEFEETKKELVFVLRLLREINKIDK